MTNKLLPSLTLKQQQWRLLGIALAGLLLIGLYATSDPAHLSSDYTLFGLDFMGAAVCHRIPARSFLIVGRSMPLCARCSGMYLGVMVVVMFVLGAGRNKNSQFPPLSVLVVLLGFMAIMGVDGINSYSHFFPNLPHLYPPQNWLRLVTGIGTGLAMGCLIVPALNQTLWQQSTFQPILASLSELVGLLILGAGAILLVLSNQPAILYVLAYMSIAGILFVLTAINTIFYLILRQQDGKLQHSRQAILPLTIGFLLALGELTLASSLRWIVIGTLTGIPGL